MSDAEDTEDMKNYSKLLSTYFDKNTLKLDVAFPDDGDGIKFAQEWQNAFKYPQPLYDMTNNVLTLDKNVEYAVEFIKHILPILSVNPHHIIYSEMKGNDLLWIGILFRIILTRPIYDNVRTVLNKELFEDQNLWNMIFGEESAKIFKSYYFPYSFSELLQKKINITFGLTEFEKQRALYKIYKLIQESLQSNDILKIKESYKEEFILLQEPAKIDEYLKIVSGIFNEKAELIANNIKKQMINSITTELDAFIKEYTNPPLGKFDITKLEYYKKFIETDIFDKYIVTYNSNLLAKFIDTAKANASKEDDVYITLFNRLSRTKRKYENSHQNYINNTKLLIDDIKKMVDDLKSKEPEYEEVKPKLTIATKLMNKMQEDYSRSMQFKNILDPSNNIVYDISGVKQYIKNSVSELQSYVKKLSDAESFLKDAFKGRSVCIPPQYSSEFMNSYTDNPNSIS